MKSDKPYYLWIELVALFIGVMGIVFPYMSAASLYGSREMSLLTGDLKPLAYICIIVLCTTAVIQYFKPQWWLIAICAAFAFIPWFSTIGIEDANTNQYFAVAKRESGAYLSLISSVILAICFVIEFCMYIRYMKRPVRLLYFGVEFLIMGALALWVYPIVDIIGVVLMVVAAPVFIFLSILGFIFAKKRNKETFSNGNLSADILEEVENRPTKPSDKKFLIWLGIALGLWTLILLGLRSVSPSEEEMKNYKEVIVEEACVYKSMEDKENGLEPIAILKKGDKVEVRFADKPWVVMRYKDLAGNLIKGFMQYEDLYFSEEANPKKEASEPLIKGNSSSSENSGANTFRKEDNEEINDDWAATTSIDWEGTINGKWKIEMTVHRLDGMVWGSYCYTKNKTRISLDGQWGERHRLILTESVDGNITGRFIGTYGDDSFDGIWISADGDKKYPFTLKPVYKVEP